jgi:hypothetical protein
VILLLDELLPNKCFLMLEDVTLRLRLEDPENYLMLELTIETD